MHAGEPPAQSDGMSSPLSTLGKHRRAPLPGLQGAPRRTEPQCATALLNKLLSHVPWDPLPANGRSSSSSKNTEKTSPSSGCHLNDLALMSTMVQKLGLLERTVHSQALDLQKKEKKISVLEEKLKVLQSSTARAGGGPQVQELEATCVRLQQQVWEMERFLNDYGMVWVGSTGDVGPFLLPEGTELEEEEEEEEEVRHRPSNWQTGASVNTPFCMDFDLVLQNVRDLNVLAGEGECHVEVMQGGARLVQHTPIPLVLYGNGIVMFNGPFRPYEDPNTQQCILDLMDGYFPSELQDRFPDGVTFKVSDRRHETFHERPQLAMFPGKGRAVGRAEKSAPNTIKHVLKNICKEPPCPLPGCSQRTEQFLSRLPERTMEAHDEVADKLSSMPQVSAALPRISTVTVVDTAIQQASKNRPALCCATTTLRLRSEDGETIFVLRMLPSDTIGQVRRYLDAHRGQHDASYDIVSAFPQRHYNDSETLAACGLTRNTTLLLRPRASPLIFHASA